MSFSINCIELYQDQENKKHYKNLSEQRYFFNDYFEHSQTGNTPSTNESSIQKRTKNFFGDNINIQAIVGKNGSGKSTLIDLIFMAANNFAFLYLDEYHKENLHISFIDDLYVNIYYSIDSTDYKLSCQGKNIQLQEILQNQKNNDSTYSSNTNKKSYTFQYGSLIKSNYNISNLAKIFFYSICTNYSIQSYLPTGYTTYCLEKDSQKKRNWIENLFHKNDNYKTPIVINPRRENGKIDAATELKISKERLLVLLTYCNLKGKKEFDGKFEIKSVKVTLNKEKILKQFELDSLNNLVHKMQGHLGTPRSSYHTLLELCSLPNMNNKSSTLKIFCLAYLVKKLEKMVNTISSYMPFKKSFRTLHKCGFQIIDQQNFIELLRQISTDDTYNTRKIKRCFQFLSFSGNESIFNEDISKPFSFQDYNNELTKIQKASNPIPKKDIIKRNITLERVSQNLPPPIFHSDILLFDSENKKEVIYETLSSGEIQFLQTLATHIYHFTNLESLRSQNKQLLDLLIF